ncbi:hypothetical protein E5D57_010752 [Metarhizium anisopliae]|nr:hypothetical protein E5D57_010752 [Metarhizium anisopliae]
MGFEVSCYGTIVGDLPRRMGHVRRQATDWHDAPARLTALEWFPRTRPAEEGVGRDAGKDGEERRTRKIATVAVSWSWGSGVHACVCLCVGY